MGETSRVYHRHTCSVAAIVVLSCRRGLLLLRSSRVTIWSCRSRSIVSAIGTRERRSNVTKLDVGVDDLCAGAVGFNFGWNAGGGGAGATSDTGHRWVGVGGVVAVEPKHADGRVV